MSQFVRVAEESRPRIAITVDGDPVEALEGDTVLTALLTSGRRVRESEFGDHIQLLPDPCGGFIVFSTIAPPTAVVGEFVEQLEVSGSRACECLSVVDGPFLQTDLC